jgi:hypothetical protein
MIETYYEANGFYEPNWFYMYLSNFDSTNLDFSQCTGVQKGLYIHEYTHYLQNIITVSGIRNAISYFRFLNELQVKLGSLENIELPILNTLFSERTIANKEKYDILKGGSFFNESKSFDRFDTSTQVQVINGKNERLLRVHFYEKCESVGYINYGNLCVKEGMSRALQSIYDPTLNQPFYPYRITELLVNQYCPIISNRPIHIAVLSSLALNFENSGQHFFRLLQEFNEVAAETSFKDFVRSELYSNKIEVNGVPGHALKDILIESLEELRTVLNNFLKSNLIYVNDLFDNIVSTEKNYELLFFDILIDSNLSDTEKLNELKSVYGTPVIQLDNELLFPGSVTNPRLSEELNELIVIKTLADRLFEANGRKTCRYLPICNRDPDFETDENCFDKQWKRTVECPFTIVADYWNIRNKLPS